MTTTVRPGRSVLFMPGNNARSMHVPVNRHRSTVRAMNHRRVICHAIVSLCFCMTWSLPAMADINEARRLANDGQTDQALAHVAQMLRAQPADIAARLLHGVLLSSSGQSDAAIDAFLGIAEERPDLPEPHNNLAVLYAAQGRYDDARTALTHAIKLQPDYDVAHENLGDVYLKLAFLSFSSAEQINPNNTNAVNKAMATRALLDASQSRRSIAPADRDASSATPQSAAPTTPVSTAKVASEPSDSARSSSRSQPNNSKQNTAPPVTVASAAQVHRCVKLTRINPASHAEEIVRWLNRHGMQASISNSPADSSVGQAYRVLLPAEQGAAQARERIAQLRAKNVTDLIIIARGEYANGISLGVFAKRSGAEGRQAALATKEVHAQIVEHRSSTARDNAAVVARGPFNSREFTREFAQITYEISHDINACR